MQIEQIFEQLVANLEIPEKKQLNILKTLNTITRKLNKNYYNMISEKEKIVIAGSHGRKTATDNISDLDVLYELPERKYIQYKNHSSNGPSKLLQEVKKILDSTYPKTKVRGDGQVVVLEFSKILLELCPVFKNPDNTFTYPDANGAKWKNTNPLAEIMETEKFNEQIEGHHYNLSKILRAWKINNGVNVGGLAIDTLCYNFLKNKTMAELSYSNYLYLLKEIFKEWSEISTEIKHWPALGSGQKVYRKRKCNLTKSAKKSLKNVIKIIEKPEREANYLYWKELFGKYMPKIRKPNYEVINTEMFIEDIFPIDLKTEILLFCDVQTDGFRRTSLKNFIDSQIKLKKEAELFFEIECDVKGKYEIYWKIKNEQDEAERKNQIRGQIIKGKKTHKENTAYTGIHTVEVYIIKENVCIARSRLEIPIK